MTAFESLIGIGIGGLVIYVFEGAAVYYLEERMEKLKIEVDYLIIYEYDSITI